MERPENSRAVPNSPASGGETSLRDLLERLPLAVFEIDLDGRFVYINGAGLERLGYAKWELAQGLSVMDVVAPEDRDHLRENIARRLHGGLSDGFQYTTLCRDGSTFPAAAYTVVVSKDSHPYGLQGYFIDISEQARTEAILRRRMALEQLVMQTSTGLVAELTPNDLDACIDNALADIGRFLHVDRSFVFLFSPDSTLADNTHEWVADSIAAERPHLQHLVVEKSLPWFVAELRQHLVVAVPVVADLPAAACAERAECEREGIRSLVCVALVHDRTVGGFLGLCTMRRQRSWSEDEMGLLRVMGELLMGAIVRRQAKQALQESEAKYKALIETTATGFVILDARGHVLEANAEYIRLSGHRTLQAIRGRAVMEWTAKHDRARNAEAVGLCVQAGFVRNLPIDYVHPDGTIVPVLLNATATEVEGKRKLITIIRDMSDHRRLQEELLRSEKQRSIGILAGGIAHDFNNILTAILGNVSLLQTSLAVDGAASEHLDEVVKASMRARELTRQLLTFSRGGEPLRRPFHLTPLIREKSALALQGRASTCEFTIAPDLALVDGDEGQLGQVIHNLVINASQAMKGSGTIRVSAENRRVRKGEVHALEDGDYVVLTVADEGDGISEEHRLRIFDPYFTTKHDGHGLGLAVSYSIVTNHLGAITVTSQLGQGSVFTVYLPAAAAVVAPTAKVELVPGCGRILVMDDEESVRHIATKILHALGYHATLACDGREAIDCWQLAREKGQPFDVAIMDLTVPGRMGGREAMQELLAIDPEAKAVVSSGYSEDPVMANYRDYGFRDVLAKPYSVADLSRVLSALLRSG